MPSWRWSGRSDISAVLFSRRAYALPIAFLSSGSGSWIGPPAAEPLPMLLADFSFSGGRSIWVIDPHSMTKCYACRNAFRRSTRDLEGPRPWHRNGEADGMSCLLRGRSSDVRTFLLGAGSGWSSTAEARRPGPLPRLTPPRATGTGPSPASRARIHRGGPPQARPLAAVKGAGVDPSPAAVSSPTESVCPPHLLRRPLRRKSRSSDLQCWSSAASRPAPLS